MIQLKMFFSCIMEMLHDRRLLRASCGIGVRAAIVAFHGFNAKWKSSPFALRVVERYGIEASFARSKIYNLPDHRQGDAYHHHAP